MEIAVGHDFLARAGFAFDQNRERRIGVLLQLTSELLNCRTGSDQQLRYWCCLPFLECPVGQCAFENQPQIARVAGLCDEVGGAERAGMTGKARIALPG